MLLISSTMNFPITNIVQVYLIELSVFTLDLDSSCFIILYTAYCSSYSLWLRLLLKPDNHSSTDQECRAERDDKSR